MEQGSLFGRIRQIFQIEEEFDEEMKKEAASLIRNIFRYMDKDAKDIMTHRSDILAIDEEETLEHAMKFMLEENFSRYPVYREDIDEIIGFLHLREAMTCYMDPALRSCAVGELKTCIRPVKFIPETKNIDNLFREMQAKKNHVVIVLDEYGQTAGLVTMEDILEEIVGNIMDEHDEEEEVLKQLADGSYEALGVTELEDLEDLFGIKFNKEDYGTLNGFLIEQLDCIPSEEEETRVIEYEGYRFTVLEVENNRIEHVKIEKIEK